MSDIQLMNQPKLTMWRPHGFEGVEIERFDDVPNLVPSPVVLPGYEFTIVRRAGRFRVEYARENHRFSSVTSDLFLAQHPGEFLVGSLVDPEPMSVWTLRLYPEAMERVKADLNIFTGFSYFPDMLAPAEINNPLARLTRNTVLTFSQTTSHLERETKLLDLVYTVLKHCSVPKPPEHTLGREHRAVSLVKEVIQAHPEQEHGLDRFAKLTGLNKFYLMRVFKRDVGFSPYRYQALLRIERAKNLLVEGVSLAQVSLETGFTDQSHFTHAFKRYTQVTPGRFQRGSLGAERFKELSG